MKFFQAYYSRLISFIYLFVCLFYFCYLVTVYMYVIEGIADCDFLKTNRGYYVAARRCEISLRVSENTIPE